MLKPLFSNYVSLKKNFEHVIFCYFQLTLLFSWKILEDPSPSPSKNNFSPEFCSFIDACLQKDPDTRPTAEQVNKMTGGICNM